MALRHHNVWDDVGDERLGFGRPQPARPVAGRLGVLPPNGAQSGRRPAPPPPVAAAPPLAFASDSVEAKLAMGLGDLLLKKGVPATALHGSGIDVARLASPEPRGSRFQRLSRLAVLPAGKALLSGALPPTARSVEQLTLTAEIGALESEMVARQQFERQAAMRLRQADLTTERARPRRASAALPGGLGVRRRCAAGGEVGRVPACAPRERAAHLVRTASAPPVHAACNPPHLCVAHPHPIWHTPIPFGTPPSHLAQACARSSSGCTNPSARRSGSAPTCASTWPRCAPSTTR